MVFKKLTEKDLGKLKKKRSREACLSMIELIEAEGVKVDLLVYPDTITGFIDAIIRYQELVPEPLGDVPADPEDGTPEALPVDDEASADDEATDAEEPPEAEPEQPPEPEPEEVSPKEVDTSEPETEEEDEEVVQEAEAETEEETKDELPPYVKNLDLPNWQDLPGGTDREFITQTYVRFLERHVDPSGMATYVNYLKSGMPREQFIIAIKRSDEYRNLQIRKKKAEAQSS